MRSIYTSSSYKEQAISFNAKQKLANQMRHSVLTASRHYYKLLDSDNLLPKDEELENINNKLNY